MPSSPTHTFLNTNFQTYFHSTVRKREKWRENNIVETTDSKIYFLVIRSSFKVCQKNLFCTFPTFFHGQEKWNLVSIFQDVGVPLLTLVMGVSSRFLWCLLCRCLWCLFSRWLWKNQGRFKKYFELFCLGNKDWRKTLFEFKKNGDDMIW